MTVGQLIELLERFPSQLPVFFSPDAAGQIAFAPRDAVMNLVNSDRSKVMKDDDSASVVPDGFVDSVVVYPREVGGYGTQ